MLTKNMYGDLKITQDFIKTLSEKSNIHKSFVAEVILALQESMLEDITNTGKATFGLFTIYTELRKCNKNSEDGVVEVPMLIMKAKLHKSIVPRVRKAMVDHPERAMHFSARIRKKNAKLLLDSK